MSSVTLEAAHIPADYQVFRQLLQEYAARDLDSPQHSSIWGDIADLPGRYAPPQGAVLFCHWQGELAGCGAMAPTAHAGMVELKRIYIRDDFRRKGLARTVTQALMLRALDAGYHTAAISTWSHNTQALRLYHQLGFAPIAPFKQHPSQHLLFLGVTLAVAGADAAVSHS